MFSAAGISTSTLVELTFLQTTDWIAPAGILLVDMEGNGGRGEDGYYYTVQQYTTNYETTSYEANGNTASSSGSLGTSPGPVPLNYCEEGPGGGIYVRTYTCYAFNDASFEGYQPESQGFAATGIDKAFPGSTGNKTPPTTTFKNVAVSPGSNYRIFVPNGGMIKISFYS